MDPEQHLPGVTTILRAWAQTWDLRDIALFGSILTKDFTTTSDVDVLVRWSDENRRYGAWGQDPAAEDLAKRLGRPVDVLSWDQVHRMRNPFRRHHILSHHQVIDAA